jgi:ribose transport system substrate-binding protein
MYVGKAIAAAVLAATGIVAVASTGSGAALRQRNAAGHVGSATPAPAQTNAELVRDEQLTVNTTKYKKSPPYTIGVIPQGPINGWGEMFNLTLQYTLKHSGKVRQILLENPEGTPNNQISEMQTMIVERPDAIILTPLSEAGLAGPVARAQRAGIPVILCGSSVSNADWVTQGGRNLYQTAYNSATELAKMMGGKGNLMMLNGIAGSTTAITWNDAAHDALKKFPKIHVVADEYATWSISKSKTVASAIISAHPKITGVWTGGSEGAIGTIEAFASSNRPMPIFGTTNPLNGFLALAKRYHIRFVADPYPPEMSQLCSNLALKVLEGKPVKKYVDMLSLVKGSSQYTTAQLATHYEPQYDTTFIGPAVIPARYLKVFLVKK